MASRNKTDFKSLFHRGLLLPALLAVAAWLGGAYYIEANIIAPRSARQVAQAAQREVQAHAAKLQQYLAAQARELQTISADEGPLQSAALPGATVQAFAADQLRVGAGSDPRLNFALVDLLKRTQRKTGQPAEFLRTGENNSWQLHRAISQQDKLLLVTQPFTAFEDTLKKLDKGKGHLQLVQKFPDGPPQTLWQTGQGSGTASSAKVGGSYLTIEFKPSPAFAKANGISARWVYFAALAGLIISLLLLLRFMPRDSKAPWEKSNKKAGDGTDAPEPQQTESLAAIPSGPIPQAVTAVPDEAPRSKSEPQQRSTAPQKSDLMTEMDFPAHVFRAYDIRGIAEKEINEPFAYQLGRVLGTLVQHMGGDLLLVGRDGRNSSELLSNCLVEGILDSGCNSVNLGLVPSPLLYFACAKGKNTSSGVMVTASHNPAEYNGFKIILKGRPLAEDKLKKLHQLMQKGPFKSGRGSNREQDIKENYIDTIFNDVALAGQPHLVIDAGNGATSLLAPRLFEQLGCAVTPLFCEIDGNFPNHAPDPSRPENLRALIDKVRETGADLGVALDGDGDRVTLVSASGRIAWPDQLVMLLARDILARNPGESVVFDVKSSRALAQLISQYGGRPIMWKTGHAPMKTKMLETGAILGGELSGHIFIKDRWFGFDDGIYAAARILEIMALREQSLDELLDSLPQFTSTPEILLEVEEGDKFALIEKLKTQGNFGDADVNDIDGLRLEYADGWGLVRASNTGAALTLRFEAETEDALERIRKLVMAELKKVDPKLAVPNWELL
ncbi:phosphomannomutase/phosphoglucomutase [Microbulbifer thermotolerans]|uniref:phosphomannomutase/phosphoglucomutase n=1 Tax=Microbulbifer thermotolerans TaxID=252514 RepID=UPI002248D7CE|nr:phosphomannomutase/phosphoglucomutase [Microbulbifer thermotolerans]MCX2794105.1 phosphomannomutase/phosphoglucomutase [Microbulbifer thermotolerans]MCX2833304.1 phosphomannomutase/phosphoglucomutase [Microbulbifer thermotolerans]WKT60509.1 phosphomannomutase/phosphoglucomutase [Microbulbifer thermotolerans]